VISRTNSGSINAIKKSHRGIVSSNLSGGQYHHTNVELVSTDHSGYVALGRRYKALNSKKVASDPFVSHYQKALRKWEYVLRDLLAEVMIEEENRILRYLESSSKYRYREIDFIAKKDDRSLMFCEIKLKEKYKHSLGYSQSGWAQLNKSLSITNNSYNANGLSICVDMSAVYCTNNFEMFDRPKEYGTFEDIKSHASEPFHCGDIVWLNGRDVAELAIERQLLTEEQVENMSILFREANNPISILSNDDEKTMSYNTFQVLKGLIH